VGVGTSDGGEVGEGLAEGVGAGLVVGVGVGVEDGVGVVIGVGVGEMGRCPTGIMNRGMMEDVSSRMLLSVWAPFPFQLSSPLETK